MSEPLKNGAGVEAILSNTNIEQGGNTISSSLQDFEILKKLGQGAHGVVYKVRRKKDQNTYVLKQILAGGMQQKQRRECINEAILLNKLNSPYIVRYYDSFIENSQLNIVMEYCEQGDLENFIKNQMGRPLVEKKIWKFFFQIAEGLLELHSRNILHRDIKTMNIFLTGNEQIRIGDLGVAKQLQDNKSHAHSQVGTPFYMSPEIIQDFPYNEKSDVWSLGCVIYQLATFKRPFDAANQGSLMIKIQKAQFTPISGNYSQQLHKLIELCLTKDHQKRPSIQQLLTDADIQMKAKQVGHQLKVAEIITMGNSNFSEENKRSIDSPSKMVVKSKDLILFQKQNSIDKKSDSIESSDNSPSLANGRASFHNSPLERSKFRNFKLQVIANQGSGNNSEKDTPVSQNDQVNNSNQKSQIELSGLIKSPQIVSRTAKLSKYGSNKSVNSTPSERNILDQQKEQIGKHAFSKNHSSFRPFSPQLKLDTVKYQSPPPTNQNHMKSTKTQMGFNQTQVGVGNSSFSNVNIRSQILTQKESDMNFSKIVQQQYMLNQLNLQKSTSQKVGFKQLDQNEKSITYDKQILPSISQQNSKEIKYQNTLPKQEISVRRYDSCDKIPSNRYGLKQQVNEEYNNQQGILKKQSSQLNISSSLNNMNGQLKPQILMNQAKQTRQNFTTTSSNRIAQEYQQQIPLSSISQSKTFNSKRSVTQLSQTDLDLAFNQIDDNIEVPKTSENPQLSKLYKQKFQFQVQIQQLQKVCIASLGVDLYKKVLEKFKYHLNRDEDLSRQDQDHINLIIDTDLKYRQECVNKLYQIISIENQIQDVQSQIYQIELNS